MPKKKPLKLDVQSSGEEFDNAHTADTDELETISDTDQLEALGGVDESHTADTDELETMSDTDQLEALGEDDESHTVDEDELETTNDSDNPDPKENAQSEDGADRNRGYDPYNTSND
jgi:hypothetical protein